MTFLLVGILLTHRSVIYQVNFFYLRRYNKRPYLAQCLKWDTRSGFIFLVFFLDQVTATIRSMTHKCFCCCCRSNGRRPTYGNIDMYTDLLFSPAFSPSLSFWWSGWDVSSSVIFAGSISKRVGFITPDAYASDAGSGCADVTRVGPPMCVRICVGACFTHNALSPTSDIKDL